MTDVSPDVAGRVVAQSNGPVKWPSRDAMGKDRANSYIKRLLSSLLDDGLVETTGERKRGARLQKYRLTAKGVRLVAALKKKGGRK